MKLAQYPYMTITLVVSTFIFSLGVNFLVSGTLLGDINLKSLERYGGYTLEHIIEFEIWRLLVSQLIHVKQVHMFYNAFSLLALGYLLEHRLGSLTFFLIWFVAGSAGTLISTLTVPEPWNLGTGGSQAILALAAVGLVMFIRDGKKSKSVVMILALTILPAFILDFIYAENHLPKLGHVISFLIGLVFSLCYLRKKNNSEIL